MSNYTEKFEKMRIAGKLASETLDMITAYIKPGISTEKIDDLCFEFIRDKECVYYKEVSCKDQTNLDALFSYLEESLNYDCLPNNIKRKNIFLKTNSHPGIITINIIRTLTLKEDI